MTVLRVSVVIVSQGRPDDLTLCLTSLYQQQDAPEFEVIVVGDPLAAQAVKAHAIGSCVHFVPDVTPNISQLRNQGIRRAQGDVLCFIDDDAIAPRHWLKTLWALFAENTIGAAGGHVRGPDGVRLQWSNRLVQRDGSCTDFTPADDSFIRAPDHEILKLEGTNMAVRRLVFDKIGGFDPAYAFYLDETDLCVRIAEAGFEMVIDPEAWVIHGFTKSPRRRQDRVPFSLANLGQSLRVYLTKHAKADEIGVAFEEFRSAQRRRLIRWMVSGHVEPSDVGQRLYTLQRGWDCGALIVSDHPDVGPDPKCEFRPVSVRYQPLANVVRQKTHWLFSQRAKSAAKQAARTNPVDLYVTGYAIRKSTISLTAAGYWVWRIGHRSSKL